MKANALLGRAQFSGTAEWHDDNAVIRTSMRTQEVVIGDGPRLSEGLELVKPLPGDVELQKAGLHHVE